MRRVLLLCLLTPLLLSSASYVEKLQGYCEFGGQTVSIFGMSSSSRYQQSYPSCTVTIYVYGTTTPATIYADDALTAKANPFTADVYGYWSFYAAAGRYDVRLSSGGITTPFTRSDFTIHSTASGITSLGSLTGTTQTFANDTNVTITSATTTHTLGWTGTLAVARGGSGAATFTANGVLLGNTAAAFQATAAGAAYQPLRVPSGGGAPAFGAIDISQSAAVTGLLPIANGGTAAATATAAFNALSPLTTKGDTVVHNGTNNIRLGIGTNNYSFIADSGTASGTKWAQVPLASGVTGTLPIANGGTGQTAATAAFDGLDPLTAKGDLIVHNGTNSIRVGVGTNNYVLTADSAQASGVKWSPTAGACRKDTVAYTADEFKAASTTADVTLFTLAQYQKITGITIKHSVQFSDGAGAMSAVTVSAGKSGTATFYTAAQAIGEATAVADTTYLDTPLFKSGTMAAAGEVVLARFTATGADFGTGAATSLTGGSVNIWTCYVSIQ